MAIRLRIPMLHFLPLSAAMLVGCSKAPPAAEVVLTHDPAEPEFSRSITPEDRRQIDAAFEYLAAGRIPDQNPQSAGEATDRQRWEDMYAAVLYACDDTEMAVVGKTEVKGRTDVREIIGWEFRVRTVEDWPGTLTIRRLATDPDADGPQRVYEAKAEIGAFGDRTERAEALLAALDKQLTAFGRKKRLPE